MEKLKIKGTSRYLRNLILFITIYFFMGLIKGIQGDGLMSYIHLSMPNLSKGIGIYNGLALIVAFFAVLLVGKLGFKRILIAIYALFTISMICLMHTHNQGLARVFLIFIELGKGGAEAVITLTLMAYTTKENRIKVFSYAIFFNVLGEAIASFFDGKIVVYRFKDLLGITYSQANVLTSHVKGFKGSILVNYMNSYKTIIWIGVIIAILIIILSLIAREDKLDYRDTSARNILKVKGKIDFSVFKNKYIIGWVIFSILFNAESSILTPHLPIYFNRILHISRGMTSTILSLKSIGMMVFVLIAPYIIKRVGKITSLSIFLLMTGPLLILMGIGGIFGGYTILIIAICAFCKWGCTHATHPVAETLPLTLVKKESRPTFSAILSLINAIFSIIAGYFAKEYLYSTTAGYHVAFFITAGIYITASIIAFILYRNKFN